MPSIFAREWLGKRWEPLIKRTLARLLGQEVSLEFRVVQPGAGPALPAPPNPLLASLNPRYTFESFVVGEHNRLACSAAEMASLRPGHTYNPLFVYGEPGTGKTHLLHAMAHKAIGEGYRPKYISPEQLTNEFITAIRHRATEELRQRYRDTDLLLLDDVHFLGGKRQTQEFFYHTFNELHQANRQIVLCSDRPPEALPVDERLRSRFQWGLVADLRQPDEAARLSILEQRAKQLGLCTDTRCLQLLAAHCKGGIREMEGCLHRVVAYAQLHQVPLSPQTAEAALALSPAEGEDVSPTGEQVLEAVCRVFSVSLEQLQSPSRSRNLNLARQVVVYVLREKFGWPLDRIGGELGGRDHSTILYAYRRVAQSQGQWPQVQAVLAALGGQRPTARLRVV